MRVVAGPNRGVWLSVGRSTFLPPVCGSLISDSGVGAGGPLAGQQMWGEHVCPSSVWGFVRRPGQDGPEGKACR